jgi:Domain of unknown function (DUF4440)
MPNRFLGVVGVVMGFALTVFASDPAGQQKQAENYIIESERQWAESLSSGDTAPVERILADDFLGVDVDGSHCDKAQAIGFAHDGPKSFVSNHLNEVKVRFYDGTAVAQGSESWVRRSGDSLRGRFVWTDTWIRRNGKWQIVAAEDLIVTEHEH